MGVSPQQMCCFDSLSTFNSYLAEKPDLGRKPRRRQQVELGKTSSPARSMVFLELGIVFHSYNDNVFLLVSL